VREDTSNIREETNRHRQDLLFFDFLASHDGIGLSRVKGILKKTDLENLLRITKAHGRLISYEVKDDTRSPMKG
jgi:sucrose phosphorylase